VSTLSSQALQANNGVNAVLYYNKDTGAQTLAFAGTEPNLADIKNDAINALGGQASEYQAAIQIANLVQQQNPDSLVTITGHSAGGGEAALAAAATNTFAVTFNAAGVNPANYNVNSPTMVNQITNYSVATDILTLAQSVTPLRSALGTQVTLAPANLWYAVNPVAAHGMNSVEASLGMKP
jgi:dienelactone hydrolase